MSDLKLTITEDQVKEYVAQALLKEIDSKGRDVLIKQALTHLMTKKKDRYGNDEGITPLDDAFRSAVFTASVEIARDLMKNDENVKLTIRSVMAEAFEKAFVDRREDTVLKIAGYMADAFQNNGCRY